MSWPAEWQASAFETLLNSIAETKTIQSHRSQLQDVVSLSDVGGKRLPPIRCINRDHPPEQPVEAMAIATWRQQAEPQRQQRGDADLVSDIESCSNQLWELCGDHSVVREDGDEDDGAHSAADMASECMALLQSIQFDESDDETQPSETNEPQHTETETPTDNALLREFNELGDELQALMAALCGEDRPPETHTGSIPTSISAAIESPSLVSDICKSPKMKELTSRLSSRRTTHVMEQHNARSRHSFSTRLKHLPETIKAKTQGTSSPTRRLLSDAAFWRQHQSKSFRQHIARQSQARKQEAHEKEKLSKAVEYRYRRVSKPCYPLAQKARGLEVASPAAKITLPGVNVSTRKPSQSYSLRFGSSTSKAVEDRGLLCGVYLYNKRRKGTLYLTCSSVTQLKTHAKQRFKLPDDAAIVNLYREQVNKGGRKFFHRIESFDELRNGDLLCATTDSYQDMAILCAWMKQRQRSTSQPKRPITKQEKAAESRREDSTATPVQPKDMVEKASRDSLTFQPPVPAPIKLWDQNGRLMNISQRLPL